MDGLWERSGEGKRSLKILSIFKIVSAVVIGWPWENIT